VSTATLAGQRVTRATLTLPAWGIAWADVELDADTSLTGAAVLELPGLSWHGTVVSGGPSSAGRSSYRLAAGAAGWGRIVAAGGYHNDAGVKARTVLEDAAKLAGETLDADTLPAASVRLGPAWAREEGPASRTLELVAPRGWYVGEDGITRIGQRPAVTYTGKASHGPVDRARGTVTLAADDLAQLVPGVIVDGLTAVDVVHELDPKRGLRSTIWGAQASTTSRRLAAFGSLVGSLLPDYTYRGIYEFRVVTLEGDRANLQPVRASLGLSDQRRVRVRGGLAGAKASPALGSLVLVAFVNADPARPIVVGFDDPESTGFVAQSMTLQAGAGGAQPWEHVASAEGVTGLLLQLLVQIGVQNAGPVTGAGLAALALPLLAAAIPAAGTAPLDPATKAALVAALAAKAADPTGLVPGIGWPGVRGA